MKLIEPSAELWSEENISPESHIARCARVCYGKEAKQPNQEADAKLVKRLIRMKHASMLRHASVYFEFEAMSDIPQWYYSDYVNSIMDNNRRVYASTNMQFVEKNHIHGYLTDTPKEFLLLCKNNPELFSLFRLTFCITTQISTSRELNRVSPNNIAERSTRYCSSKDGLEICKPWWYDEDYIHTKDGETYKQGANRVDKHRAFRAACITAEKSYKEMLDCGVKPEDARGVLPLDTVTKVVYTYSVAEWKHIIDLRFYGTTGKPHPNAKLVIGIVRDKINEFARAHNINYQI